jgi:hypothetical protein
MDERLIAKNITGISSTIAAVRNSRDARPDSGPLPRALKRSMGLNLQNAPNAPQPERRKRSRD